MRSAIGQACRSASRPQLAFLARRGLGFRVYGLYIHICMSGCCKRNGNYYIGFRGYSTSRLENQMEKKMEDEMEPEIMLGFRLGGFRV